MIIDWYYIATGLFSTVILLTLISLKLSLKNENEVSHSQLKKYKAKQNLSPQQTQTPNQLAQAQPTQKPPTIKILIYLLSNYTFLEVCIARKSKNKLPMFLALAAVSGLCLINTSLLINCVVGIPITLGFFFAQVCLETDQNINVSILDGQIEDFEVIRQGVKQQPQTISKRKRIFIFYAIASIGLSLFLCGRFFKNYSNLFLSQYLLNASISCCADLFVVRTVAFLALCFPLSFNNRVLLMIENEKLRQEYSQFIKTESLLPNCATNLSPRKKQGNSPTKIPRAMPKIQDFGKQNSQNEALQSAMQIAKKIKKEKRGSVLQSLTLNKINEVKNANSFQDQYSLNNLFEEKDSFKNDLNKTKNGRQTPVAMFASQDQYLTNGAKTKRKDTDLVIVQFKRSEDRQQEQIQNVEKSQLKQDEQNDNSIIQRKTTSFLHSNLDFDDDFNKRQQSQGGISGHDGRLNIIKLLNQCTESLESGQRDRDTEKTKKHENSFTLNIDRNGPLYVRQNSQILEQGEMQQIDCNSPERRRKKLYENEDSQFKLKKKAKHFNGNAKRRVIKFTSGEPYLEYLPNMLSKNGNLKHKKSQPINSKPQMQILDQRRKSMRKIKKQPKFAFGGDQNHYPGTMQVQDI